MELKIYLSLDNGLDLRFEADNFFTMMIVSLAQIMPFLTDEEA